MVPPDGAPDPAAAEDPDEAAGDEAPVDAAGLVDAPEPEEHPARQRAPIARMPPSRFTFMAKAPLVCWGLARCGIPIAGSNLPDCEPKRYDCLTILSTAGRL
jgi:hypothetical protein